MPRLQTLRPRVQTIPGRLQVAATIRRMRGRKLQAFRSFYLSQHPLCEHCSTPARPVVATQVDHKVALVNGGKDFDEDPDQAQALCEECHRKKTATDLGYTPRPQIGTDGWPIA